MTRHDENNPYRSPSLDPETPDPHWSAPQVDPDSAIRMEGVLTRREVQHALKLHARRPNRSRVPILVLFLPTIVFMPYLFLTDAVPAAALVMWANIALYFIVWGLGRLRARHRLAQFNVEPERRFISEHALRMDSPTASATYPWSVFSGYLLFDDTVLLSFGRRAYLVFPRSWCSSDADWQAFLALVARKFPQPPK